MELINVMASSLDGRIGGHSLEGDQERQEVGLSSEEDQEYLRNQISQCDAIIVGAGSIRSNQSCLSHPGSKGRYPHWYVLAQRPIPESFSFWQQDELPRTIVTKEVTHIPENATGCVENLVYGSHDPAKYLYDHLENQGFRKVLLFGGGIINRMFYEKRLVNELRLTIAPLFIGKSNAPYLLAPELESSIRLDLLSCDVSANSGFLFLNYGVK